MAKVLIVDDSRVSRHYLRTILEENGQEGYEKFIELEPDVVTLDITMPVLDGLGALDKIMTLNNESNVIMVTSAGQKEKMVEAIKLGATEFIQKPFNPDQILDILKGM